MTGCLLFRMNSKNHTIKNCISLCRKNIAAGWFFRHRKTLPALALMGICLMRTYRQHRVKQQYALSCPLFQVTIVWNIAAQIILQFFVNID